MKTFSTLKFAALPLAALTIAACGESAAEQEADMMEDRMEMQADQSALESGNEVVALGLTEAQLLEADLVSSDGTDLGDVERIERDTTGNATGFVVGLDDTDPDRYVSVPLDGLTTRTDGDDIDLETTMTAQDLAGLPDATMRAM